jgi:hypothetical protein
MRRTHLHRGLAALAAVLVFGAVALLAVWQNSQNAAGLPAARGADEPPLKKRATKPVSMLAHPVGLEIDLGRKDMEPAAWDGDVQVSEGRLVDMTIRRGGANAKVDGSHFTGRSVKQQQAMMDVIVGPILRIGLDAPPTATVSVQTKKGKFEFKLEDLKTGTTKEFLDGGAVVERQEGSVRLTGRETEDDFPALARGPDGTLWLAYVEYKPGKPVLQERITAGNFDELVPTGNGDQVLLVRFDGKAWQPPVEVTAPGLDIWRPTVAVDGKGVVCIAWAQQVDGNWDIYYRRYTPPAREGEDGALAETRRLTTSPGTDYNVVSTTDSAGTVWAAWQSWREDHFDILVAALQDDHPAAGPRALTDNKANNWCPAIAADARGNVYVAHDTYAKGNYDVRLHRLGKEPASWTVAGSPLFEARPSVACAAEGRVWVAYEEGEEQWGKDFANNQFQRIGLEKNPGAALYGRRTVQVRCLDGDKFRQPAGDIPEYGGARQPRKKSVPRLAVDAAGGIWLLFRQHPRPGLGGGGEVWNSYATRYDGKQWSSPRQLAGSANLIDNRPALAPFGQGLLAVYSGDNRIRTQNRDQDDLFAAILSPEGATQPLQLVDAAAPAEAKVKPVHPDEAADVARLREFRLESDGKTLRLLRGEFHRHTEFSSHADQDGLLEDSWRYALDPGNLDWMGNGDHDNGFHHEYMWWLIQKTTDLFQHPPRFVAAHTYERSVVYPNGHRNVMMPRRGIRPLQRGGLPGTEEKGSADTKLLYAYLKHFDAICASHTSGTDMGTDWRDNDPLVEPVVEIYQGHRHNYEHSGAPRSATAQTQIGGYQPKGYVWNAFEKGYRFGFEASSDHVSVHMSYGVVFVDDVSRAGIIDAFKKRHCYAATDNILLVVRSGDHLMGDAFESNKRPTLSIQVHGTAPVAKLHVIKDNKYVYSTEPKEREIKELRYTDMDAKAGETSYYYVRIEQADGNLAWGSPMWITYKP